MREVWFIRHGESVANAGEKTTEAGTYPLSERGFRQAQQLGGALTRRPDLIVHSPYLRAQQTAEPAMARYPQVPVEVWPVQEVQYLDPALCMDTTQEDRQTLARNYWSICDPDYAAPKAESFVTFIERAQQALRKLAGRTEPFTYVFCHGHFMRAIAWAMLYRPAVLDRPTMRHFLQFMPSYTVGNGAVQTVYFHPDGVSSLGPLWVPEGVEREPADVTERGQEGV
jgi:2,3-bisphosphoglycerate-dependent phosphoglycerate mutase